jgi:hypothetical protein
MSVFCSFTHTKLIFFVESSLSNVKENEKLTHAGYKNRSYSQIISVSALSGLVGGIVMIPFFLIPGIFEGIAHMMTLFEVMCNAFTGATGSTAIILGMTAHLVTSVVVGIIFGIILDKIKKFELTSVRKSIGVGLIVGAVIFVTLNLPVFGVFLPPFLIQAAANTYHVTTEQATTYYQNEVISKNIGFGFIQNLVFGIVFCLVTRALTSRSALSDRLSKK